MIKGWDNITSKAFRYIILADEKDTLLTGNDADHKREAMPRVLEYIAIVVVASLAANLISGIMALNQFTIGDLSRFLGCILLIIGAAKLYGVSAELQKAYEKEENIAKLNVFFNKSGSHIRKRLSTSMRWILYGIVLVSIPASVALIVQIANK
jgi:hypothetical protein